MPKLTVTGHERLEHTRGKNGAMRRRGGAWHDYREICSCSLISNNVIVSLQYFIGCLPLSEFLLLYLSPLFIIINVVRNREKSIYVVAFHTDNIEKLER